jgi:hypothetical protein
MKVIDKLYKSKYCLNGTELIRVITCVKNVLLQSKTFLAFFVKLRNGSYYNTEVYIIMQLIIIALLSP